MSPIDDLLKASGLVVKRAESPNGDVRRVFLHAGQVTVATEPAEITTILGSCVAICMWDRDSGIGGMNHYMLPHDIGSNYATPRYAAFATNKLLTQLIEAGADMRRLQAKVFGGACILAGAVRNGGRDLGALNVRVAYERLEAAGIRVVGGETGGMHGRKLVYLSATGDTVVTRVSRVVP
jgi:chemotaxis protein CheD